MAADAAVRRPSLVIAVDVPTGAAALELAGAVASLPVWLKVGLELFTAEGPTLVRALMGDGFPVFLDLKFHDIPNTVQGAVRSASHLGVSMVTIHSAGGEAMCRAAVAGRDEAVRAGAQSPLLMGVTVLTSDGGDPETVSRLVLERAAAARRWGLDGVVCSGREAAAVKQLCGKDFLCLCPGIRFADAGRGVDDQARVCTPEQAVAAGADFLVVGRPVTRSGDPGAAAEKALAAMRVGHIEEEKRGGE